MGCLKIEKINTNTIASIYAVVMTECIYTDKENIKDICNDCEEDMCKVSIAFENSKENTCAIATTVKNVEGTYLNIVSITKRFTYFKDQIIDFIIKYNESIGIDICNNTFIEIINCDINEIYSIKESSSI